MAKGMDWSIIIHFSRLLLSPHELEASVVDTDNLRTTAAYRLPFLAKLDLLQGSANEPMRLQREGNVKFPVKAKPFLAKYSIMVNEVDALLLREKEKEK